MRAVPQFVYVFRRVACVDGPQSIPVQTDVIVIRSSTEMLPHEVTNALEAMVYRPVSEYQRIDAQPDVWLRLDSWELEIETCHPAECSNRGVQVINLGVADSAGIEPASAP